MSKIYKGACLCGQVSFEIVGDFQHFFLCHCAYCQKDTGTAHAANLFSATAKLKWLAGEEKVCCYTHPSTRHVRCFCPVCGSALPNQQRNPDFLVVPAGSLDSDVALKPEAHLFMASKANWDEVLEQVPRLDGLPDS